MLASLFGRCIGLSALVCVLLLFFFPLAHGNFQSTHGPTTELRSRRAFLTLVFSMVRAALQIFAALVATLTMSFGRLVRGSSSAEICDLFGNLAILRC
jgi:hypothetical protein